MPETQNHKKRNLSKSNHPNIIIPSSNQCLHSTYSSRKCNLESKDTKQTEEKQKYKHNSSKKTKKWREIITMCPVVELAHGGEDPLQVAGQGARVCTIPNTKPLQAPPFDTRSTTEGMETNPTFPRNNSGLKRKAPRSEHPPIGRAHRIRQFH